MRFGLRSLRRRPLFAAAAVLTIALGIGVNTTVFGVVYSVLLQPLPFRDSSRLVEIWQAHPALPQLQVTVPDYQEFRFESRSFESIAAYTLSAMNAGTLLGQGAPEFVHATMASPNLFPTMGIQSLAGRAFTAREDHDRNRVALLSEALWRRKFAADPSVIGARSASTTEPSRSSASSRSDRLFRLGPTSGFRCRLLNPTSLAAANTTRSN